LALRGAELSIALLPSRHIEWGHAAAATALLLSLHQRLVYFLLLFLSGSFPAISGAEWCGMGNEGKATYSLGILLRWSTQLINSREQWWKGDWNLVADLDGLAMGRE